MFPEIRGSLGSPDNEDHGILTCLLGTLLFFFFANSHSCRYMVYVWALKRLPFHDFASEAGVHGSTYHILGPSSTNTRTPLRPKHFLHGYIDLLRLDFGLEKIEAGSKLHRVPTRYL